MNFSSELSVVPLGERGIVMTRGFNAPRDLVFDAWTKPELLKRWLGVRDGWRMDICQVDLKVGGSYRFVWRHATKGELGIGGTYREILRPDRLVYTERFEQAWVPGEAIVTAVFVEEAGRTMLTTTVLSPSAEVRDAVLKSGMARGVDESYQMLDGLLASGPVIEERRPI
jgi:uncharacterized protein YndB with AHSA1/START domain